MNLQLPLSPDAESRLRELAAAAGQDVQAFVLAAVEEKLAENALPESPKPKRDQAEWVKAFHAWGASHPRCEHFVDDNRESIYDARGE